MVLDLRLKIFGCRETADFLFYHKRIKSACLHAYKARVWRRHYQKAFGTGLRQHI